MAYLSEQTLIGMGFKKLGKNVKISEKASVYDCEKIEIGDYSRIDDFCVVSGNLKIGRNNHITPHCLIAGGEQGIVMADFVTLAYGVQVFTQSDDYSGETMTNSTVPGVYKNEKKEPVIIEKHSIIGAGSIIMPGVHLREGTSIGALSLVLKSTEPWSIYAGSPARKLKDRSKKLLLLEEKYLKEANSKRIR
ncbi:MAG: acyltransferase [Thermodesulfobacteriota bacterium]|nr:acyltransferase [Thermodesulfobacteriota bacterium]